MTKYKASKRTVKEIEALLRCSQKARDSGEPGMSPEVVGWLVYTLRVIAPASPVLVELGLE
jgi:hypothetical protein